LPMDSRDNMYRPRVKVCGTTRLVDATLACSLGVDALGFIFYPKSPRFIDTAEAARIIDQLPLFVDRVGVFVNSSLSDLEKAVGAGLSVLQLHGEESPQKCETIRKEFPHCRIIKAFPVGRGSSRQDFAPYSDCVDCFLLDTYVKGAKGGTGEVFDWSVIEGLRLTRPVLLAGGLSPLNIEDALRMVRPYGVDVNSGIEVEPGVKDHALLRQFMRLVAQSLH
jgi:phosphoribosylanthranilate isomerase